MARYFAIRFSDTGKYHTAINKNHYKDNKNDWNPPPQLYRKRSTAITAINHLVKVGAVIAKHIELLEVEVKIRKVVPGVELVNPITQQQGDISNECIKGDEY